MVGLEFSVEISKTDILKHVMVAFLNSNFRLNSHDATLEISNLHHRAFQSPLTLIAQRQSRATWKPPFQNDENSSMRMSNVSVILSNKLLKTISGRSIAG